MQTGTVDVALNLSERLCLDLFFLGILCYANFGPSRSLSHRFFLCLTTARSRAYSWICLAWSSLHMSVLVVSVTSDSCLCIPSSISAVLVAEKWGEQTSSSNSAVSTSLSLTVNVSLLTVNVSLFSTGWCPCFLIFESLNGTLLGQEQSSMLSV